MFNEEGTIDIILQKIADESEISIGNLTYHYKNKEEIIIALFDVLNKETDEVFNKIPIIPTEENIIEVEYNLMRL